MEHTPEVLVLAVGKTRLTVMVHSEILDAHSGNTLVREWIGDIKIGIGIESGRERGRCTIVSASTTIGTDQDVREGIGLPLETDITIPAIVARETLRIGVREGAVGLAVEVLAAILINIIAATVIPTDTTIDLKLLTIVVVEVGTKHLTTVQTTTVPPTGILLLVIEVAGDHDTGIVSKTRGHTT